jgi:CSLREA domain-containing protein
MRRGRSRLRAIVSLLLLAGPGLPGLLLLARPVYAATFTVTTTQDAPNVSPTGTTCVSTLPGGPCTLRAAIQAANFLGSGPHTIDLPAGTYVLTVLGADEDSGATGDLDITANVVITGAGAPATILDATPSDDRVLDIHPGGTGSLSGVTIRNGNGARTLFGANIVGGGIRNAGTLIAVDAAISSNRANAGGGIANAGTATLTNVTISNNATQTAGEFGGQGGGLANSGTFASPASAALLNVTISGNIAATAGAAAPGGGLYTFFGTTAVTNGTINSNSIGISNDALTGPSSRTQLSNTIVANSTRGSNCTGPIESTGDNLSSDSTCNFTAAGDRSNIDPLLAPLANNDGPTATHALQPGSPAIDAVTKPCPPPTTDQRGVSRPQGSRCDIGAFELQPSLTPTATATTTPTATPTRARLPGDFNGDGIVDIQDYGVWRQQFGATNCGSPADADGNCLVDIRDYGIWRQHFGETSAAATREGGNPTTATPIPGRPAGGR